MNNVVQGNFIGTNRAGASLGNGAHGVYLEDASNTAIGGSSGAQPNVIAFNGQNGVTVVQANGQATSNSIIGNSIFFNALLGIDLGFLDGVTPNDARDRDGGANRLQNFPVLSSVIMKQGVTTVKGKLHSTPNTEFRIEIFSTGGPEFSGHGEGLRLVGLNAARTNRRGIASFSAILPLSVSAGQIIAATATDPQNNTSEFSRAQQVVAFQPLGDRAEIELGRERSSPHVAQVNRAGTFGVEVIDTVLNQLVRRRRRGDPAADRLLA